MYGRKRLFQAAIVIFLSRSALAGISQSIVQLIEFRALQRLGGGGPIIGAHAVIGGAVIGGAVAPRNRGR